MRHEAQREGELGARRGAIDAWGQGLLAKSMLTQDAGWYTDNGKYRQVVTLVFNEWQSGREKARLPGAIIAEKQTRAGGEEKGEVSAAGTSARGGGKVADVAGNDVAALHSKFFQDPTTFKGKFGGVDAFDAGIEKQVRPRTRRQHLSLWFQESIQDGESVRRFLLPPILH